MNPGTKAGPARGARLGRGDALGQLVLCAGRCGARSRTPLPAAAVMTEVPPPVAEPATEPRPRTAARAIDNRFSTRSPMSPSLSPLDAADMPRSPARHDLDPE